jgi:hypothetical protein
VQVLFYDDHSGVVQQAGHAALDRRIGVRIPAPEIALMARPHRLEAKDAALSRQKPEFESRWGHLKNQALLRFSSPLLFLWCPQSVYRPVRTEDRIQTVDRLLQMIGREMGIPRRHA